MKFVTIAENNGQPSRVIVGVGASDKTSNEKVLAEIFSAEPSLVGQLKVSSFAHQKQHRIQTVHDFTLTQNISRYNTILATVKKLYPNDVANPSKGTQKLVGSAPPPPPPSDEWLGWFITRGGQSAIRRGHLHHINWSYVQAMLSDGFLPDVIPVIPTIIDLSALGGIRRGKKRGKGGNDRKMVMNPEERARIRETLVWLMLRKAFPLVVIEDRRVGKQDGADFIVKTHDGLIVAYVDAKSSNVMTWPQYKKALELAAELESEGVQYWIVGTSFIMQISSKTEFAPTQGKVYNR